jgi:ankyrin repeat protein
MRRFLCLTVCLLLACSASGQVPPSSGEISAYTGLLAAAAHGSAAEVEALIAKGEKADGRDAYGRTPLHVAAYGRRHEVMRALVAAGANPNAL